MTSDFNIINSPKENGVFEFFTDLGSQFFKSLQCSHCGKHWQYIKSSGIQRGYCVKCRGPLCGEKECVEECVPYEAQIELQEGNIKTILKYGGTNVGRRILCEMEALKRQYDRETIEQSK